MNPVESVTIVVAVIGAITGVAGLSLSILNYRRDRTAIKILVERGYLGQGGSDEQTRYRAEVAERARMHPVRAIADRAGVAVGTVSAVRRGLGNASVGNSPPHRAGYP